MKFSKNIIRSFVDLPNKTSMIIHSIGCNLNCYECFNYDSLVANPKKIVDEKYILNHIMMDGFLFDAIILSGGEFLNNDINEIIEFINNIKAIYNGLIIINTNGTYPEKIKILNDLNIVNGFHTDMKLPYYALDVKNDKNIINTIIGKSLDSNEIQNITQSIEYTIQFDKGYSQIRSVKYPMINNNVFAKNEIYINQLNIKYNKQTPYFINDFININNTEKETKEEIKNNNIKNKKERKHENISEIF